VFWLEFETLRSGDVAEGPIIFDLVFTGVAEHTDVAASGDVRTIPPVANDKLVITITWQRGYVLGCIFGLFDLVFILQVDIPIINWLWDGRKSMHTFGALQRFLHEFFFLLLLLVFHRMHFDILVCAGNISLFLGLGQLACSASRSDSSTTQRGDKLTFIAFHGTWCRVSQRACVKAARNFAYESSSRNRMHQLLCCPSSLRKFQVKDVKPLDHR
jgi:hypothetical protein